MTSLTLATVLIMVYGVLSRGGYGRALALGGVTASGAAAVVADTAVPTFYTVAVGTLVALGLSLLGNGATRDGARRTLPPAVSLLLGFWIWSILVTLVAPVLFDGMTVLAPSRTIKLAATVFTTSNIAQVIYLTLGVAVVLFLARSPRSRPELIGLLVGLTTLLSLWRYLYQLFGLPFPEGVLDNSPSFAYIETAPNDVERFRGIASEPAGLAGSCLVTIAYMLPRSLQLRGWRRAGALLIAAVAVYLGIVSTSTTFVVAGVAIALVAGFAAAAGFLLRRTHLSTIASVVGCLMVIGAVWVLPIVADFVESTVNEKVNSSSYTDRSSANSMSMEVFLDTFGLGVGLGANRASSFVPSLLSTTGILGTLMFVAAVATLIWRSTPVREYRPVVWALVALLVGKVISGPDLSDTTGVMWISLGLLSHAARKADGNKLAGPPAEARLEDTAERLRLSLGRAS
jgi:hypothetical protein